MSFPIKELPAEEFPPLLQEIPQPPKELNYRGVLPSPEMKLLAVVGSRKYTDYGKQVVEHLIEGLRGYNIGIISGLALGIDSLAHKAALSAQLYTLAVPGGGLDDAVIYPATHKRLAQQILDEGGGLLSEYEPTFRATTWSFPQRNRIVCGMSHATLLIEAEEKSGTLITARMTTDYNRELLVVPGNIFSPNTKGTHQFLKLGATPITDAKDILDIFHLDMQPTLPPTDITLSPEEEAVLEHLHNPTDRDTLIRQLNLPVQEASVLLMEMEMKGIITESSGTYSKK